MKTTTILLMVLLAAAPCWGTETATVPLSEFKNLYKESIEKAYETRLPKQSSTRFQTIESADYTLEIDGNKGSGNVVLTGKVVTGTPEPIKIFENETVLFGNTSIEGGNLLGAVGNDPGIFLLPTGNAPFSFKSEFMVSVKEDKDSRYLSFVIPPAVKNSLNMKIPSESTITEAPGIADESGRYHFTANEKLTVRFTRKDESPRKKIIEVNVLSRIHFQSNRLYITAYFDPVNTDAFQLTLPGDARIISSSINKSWIEKTGENAYSIAQTESAERPFWIRYTLEKAGNENAYTFQLPKIIENIGSEGCFAVEEPDGYDIILEKNVSVSRVAVSNISTALRKAVESGADLYKTSENTAVQISVNRFNEVETPPIVIDSVFFFSSFEENGGALSLLKMTIPPHTASRLYIERINDAEIWSCHVNGGKKKVYTDGGDKWIIPLYKDKDSTVELAFLRKAEKLGLQGRLETHMPEMPYPAKNAYVGIGLPERVSLVSLEGPLNPSAKQSFKPPKSFTAKPYFFSRAFYTGEGMDIALYYKEPVQN